MKDGIKPVNPNTPAHNTSSQEEILMAYKYVDSLDASVDYTWDGWSVREAFLAGRQSVKSDTLVPQQHDSSIKP
jgi:hypothetical protein